MSGRIGVPHGRVPKRESGSGTIGKMLRKRGGALTITGLLDKDDGVISRGSGMIRCLGLIQYSFCSFGFKTLISC